MQLQPLVTGLESEKTYPFFFWHELTLDGVWRPFWGKKWDIASLFKFDEPVRLRYRVNMLLDLGDSGLREKMRLVGVGKQGQGYERGLLGLDFSLNGFGGKRESLLLRMQKKGTKASSCRERPHCFYSFIGRLMKSQPYSSQNSPSFCFIIPRKITLQTQNSFKPSDKSYNHAFFHSFTTIYLHNIMHPIQLLIKLLHPDPNPNQSLLRQTARKAEQEIWMPRFSHSCEKRALPELQSSRKRQLTQSQKVDPGSRHPILAINSTQKERKKYPFRFAVDSSAVNSLNSLHLGIVANKSQRVTTISYCLQQNNKKRIYSRRKNFFALKKETSIKSTTNGVGSEQFRKNKIIKAKIMKLVGNNCSTKTQELHRLAIQMEDDWP